MIAARYALPLLLLVAGVQQYRYVSRAVLPAQDVVDFVSVAQRIDREGLLPTIAAEPVQPLFPAWICAVRRIGCNLESSSPHDWGRAAQLAAAAAAVLAVVPVFFLTRRLLGPTCATFAGLLYCLLPEFARLGADGLSDSLHLLLVAWGLWAIVAALDTADEFADASLTWWLAGSLLGAALLVRAEAVSVIAAVFVLPLFYARRSPQFRIPHSALPFAAGLLLCLIPYVAAGMISPVDIAARLRGGGAPTEDVPLNAARPASETAPATVLRGVDGVPLTFGHKDRTRSTRFSGFLTVARELLDELAQAGGYCMLPLAVFGIWSLRSAPPRAGLLLLGLVFVLHTAVVFIVAWRNGYLSTRHVLLGVIATLPFSAQGLLAIGARLTSSLVAHRSDLSLSLAPRVFAGALATIIAIACLAATSRPTHEALLAHRRATDWLRSPAAAPGRVLDQQGFTALESGRTTYRFDSAERALADPALAYVLIERADLEAASPRGASLRRVLGSATNAVARFADDRARPEREVLIFARPNLPETLQTAQRENSSHAR